MAEGTYEYECMRAELLGIEKPDYETFTKTKQAQCEVQAEEQQTEILKETVQEEESLRHISGGLGELNNILQVTQKKINRFKASCGSLTNMLKFKLSGESTASSTSSDCEAQQASCDSPHKSDLSKALDNHVDRLDSMIEQAENAQFSMSQQNKDVKRFLN